MAQGSLVLAALHHCGAAGRVARALRHQQSTCQRWEAALRLLR